MTQTDLINGIIGTLAVKAPCKVATTENITLSGAQTIDGVALTADESPRQRVLVKDQDDASENGIYDVNSGAWIRSPDFDGARDVVKGVQVRVNEGGGGVYTVTTPDPITIGTSDIEFTLSSTAVGIGTLYKISDYSNNIATVVTAIGANNATLLIDVETQGDTTVPENVNLWFLKTGQLSGDVTIYSPSNIIAQPNQQIFTGDGTIIFSDASGQEIHVEWWGTDDTALQAALTCANASAGTDTSDEGSKINFATVELDTSVDIGTLITQPAKTLFTMGPGVSLKRNYNGDLWKIAAADTRIGRIQFDCSGYTSALAADYTACLVINTSTNVDDNFPVDEIRAYGNDYASGDAVRGGVVRFDADASGKDDFYFNHWKKIVANYFKYLFYWYVTEGGGTAGIKGNDFGEIFVNRVQYLWHDNLDGATTCKFYSNKFKVVSEAGNNADYQPTVGTTLWDFDTTNNDVQANLFDLDIYDYLGAGVVGNIFDLESTFTNQAIMSTVSESVLGGFQGPVTWRDTPIPANIFTLSFTYGNLADDTGNINVPPMGVTNGADRFTVPIDCWIYAIGLDTAGLSDTNGTIQLTDAISTLDHTFTLTNGTRAYYTTFLYSDGYTLDAGEDIRLRATTANLNVATEDITVTLYLAPLKN